MMKYRFKVYRPGHAVWTRKEVWAGSVEEAATKIDEYCEQSGYIDWELEGADWA